MLAFGYDDKLIAGAHVADHLALVICRQELMS
jgi:hypothetical protein